MIRVNERLSGARTDSGVVITEGSACIELSAEDLRAIREILTGECVGWCERCECFELSAADCVRRRIEGIWIWCCPECGRPIETYPY